MAQGIWLVSGRPKPVFYNILRTFFVIPVTRSKKFKSRKMNLYIVIVDWLSVLATLFPCPETKGWMVGGRKSRNGWERRRKVEFLRRFFVSPCMGFGGWTLANRFIFTTIRFTAFREWKDILCTYCVPMSSASLFFLGDAKWSVHNVVTDVIRCSPLTRQKLEAAILVERRGQTTARTREVLFDTLS